MNNLAKYNEAYKTAFNVTEEQLGEQLVYQSVELWDSVGHMQLMAGLEYAFDIMMDVEDIIEFSSYTKGMELLSKYGVQF